MGDCSDMSSEPVKVLLIGNNRSDFVNIRKYLVEDSGQPFELVWSQNLSDGLNQVKANGIDVLLFDLNIAIGQSVRSVSRIWEETVTIPVILLCSPDGELAAAEAVKKGAQDYIVQTALDKDRLLKVINLAIERNKLKLLAIRTAELEKQIELSRLKEEFMGLLANEVWLPLLGGRLVLEHLLEGSLGEVNSQQKVAITQLKKGNEELLALTQELLDVYTYDQSRSAIASAEVDVKEVLKTCVDDITPATKYRGIKLICEMPVNVPKVWADPSGIKRVFVNLLENAVNSSPIREEIQVRVAVFEHSIKVFVTDKGRDINDEDQQRLFKRFWMGEKGRKYTSKAGMHLYLCQRIVDAHNGTITCSSQPASGTTFTVTLPTRRSGTQE